MNHRKYFLYSSVLMLLISCARKGEEFKTCSPPDFNVLTRFLEYEKDPNKTIRVFSIGHKISLETVESEEKFYNSMKNIVDAIKPCLSNRYNNLIVFEEHLGLILGVFGSRGQTAREEKKKAEDAMISVFSNYFLSSQYYTQKFPEISTFKARPLFLAITDSLWRPFFNTFSKLAKDSSSYIVSCQNVSEVEKVVDKEKVKTFVDDSVQTDFYYKALTSDVWNTCFVFSPSGEIVHKTKKVNLVPEEIEKLELSAGRYEWLDVYRIKGTEVDICIGISLDAFIHEYVKFLDDKGCDVFLQPDANSGKWAGKGGQGYWQPDEWLDSVMGVLQSESYTHVSGKTITTGYKNIVYNVNPMMTGNFFDIVFDGQSAITSKKDSRLRQDLNYIGLKPISELGRFKEGGFLLLGPWVLSGGEDMRDQLEQKSDRLAPGGSEENKYLQTILAADLFIN